MNIDSESNARNYVRSFPVTFKEGHLTSAKDTADRTYIDFLASCGALPLGHNHPVYVHAIESFIRRKFPQQMLDLTTTCKIEYIDEIRKWLPNEMQAHKFHFCSPCGSDAVEAALKLCRIATGRQTVLALSGGYHGQTLGSLLCMGNTDAKRKMGISNFNTHILPFPHKSCFSEKLSEDEIIDVSLNQFKQIFDDGDESGITKPAAVIVECVQGNGGNTLPFRWVRSIRELCSKYDVPLVCDEVLSAWMRTGKPFGFSWSDIVPDVITLAKSAGGGQPMALVIYKPELDKWTRGNHCGSFHGNQIAMVTGKHVLEHIRLSDLQSHVQNISTYFHGELWKLHESFPLLITDVRGLGLLFAIQTNHLYSEHIQSELFITHGIMMELEGRYRSSFICYCALIITKNEIDRLIESLKTILLAISATIVDGPPSNLIIAAE